MDKSPKNHHQRWSLMEVRSLQELAKAKTPPRIIAFALGRTQKAVEAKAAAQGFALKNGRDQN